MASLEQLLLGSYPLALFACAGVAAALAVRLIRLRLAHDPGPLALVAWRSVVPMAAALASLGVWLGAYALELVTEDAAASARLHRVVYMAVALLPPSVLAVALSMAISSASAHVKACALAYSVPAASLFFLVAPWSGWFWVADGQVAVGPIGFMQIAAGPWFWVHTAWSYGCLVVAFVVLARRALEAGLAGASEASMLAFAFLLPCLVNVQHVFRNVPDVLDPTPAGIALSIAVLMHLLARPGLARFLPVARGSVFDVLEDAVFVVDDHGTVLTTNAAATRLIERCAGPDGEPARAIADFCPALAGRLDDPELRRCVTDVRGEGAQEHFDVHVSRVAFSSVVPLRIVVLRNATERQRAQRDLRRMAHHDSLTGLANRRRFAERLEECLADARSAGSRAALLVVDLDHFKRVNDTGGHAAGDAVLKDVAGRLRAVALASAIPVEVARLGGDEFGLLLPQIDATSTAGAFARDLLLSLREPTERDPAREAITASIGVAIFPDDARTAEDLFRCADLAQYLAKRRGRAQFRYFHPHLDRAAQRRAVVARDLGEAIRGGKLHLVYQPQFRLDDRRVVGFEALARWDHPDIGTILPEEFVALAEEAGQGEELGAWVVETACRQILRWRARGLEPPRVAVNVSPAQFASADFVVRIAEILRREGVAPDVLDLEITEGTLLRNDERSFVALRDLRAMGCRFALDDFGAHCSSLPSLGRFQVDKLKLDGAFVRSIGEDLRAAAVVASVVHLAHTLGMVVVAEGVECAECAEVLERIGCDEIQGFALSGPIAADLAGTMMEIQGRAFGGAHA